MTTVLLVIHLFVTLALIGVVLIQRSEGGGLGIGTSQGMGGFMSGRGTANLLTRTTAILGTIFFLLSLALALLNRGTGGVGGSLLDNPPPANSGPAVPGSAVPGSAGPVSGVPGSAVPGSAVPGEATLTPGATTPGALPAGSGTTILPESPAPAAPGPSPRAPLVPTN